MKSFKPLHKEKIMEAVVSIVVLLIRLLLGIILGVFSIYLSLRFFDRMTKGIDELKELKKGNVAVAIVLLSLIVSVGTIVSKGIEKFEEVFNPYYSIQLFFIALIMAIVQIVVVILIAIIAIYTGIRILDTMTSGIDEFKELKKGNVAVAIIIAAVIYVVSFIVASSISGIGNLSIFKPETMATMVGLG